MPYSALSHDPHSAEEVSEPGLKVSVRVSGNGLPDDAFTDDGCVRVRRAIQFLVEKNIAFLGRER